MPLSLRVKVCYSVGHILNDLAASMWFSYLLLYLVYVLQVNSAFGGFLVFLGQLVEGLFTPVVGSNVDHKCIFFEHFGLRCNHRKIWHAAGSLLVAVCFPLVFSGGSLLTHLNTWGLAMYFALLVILYQLGWAMVQVSHLSLIPDMTQDQNEKDQLSNMRHAFNVGFDIILFLIVWFVFHWKEQQINPTDDYKFMFITIGVVVCGFMTSSIFYLGTRVPSIDHSTEVSRRMEWKGWMKNKNFHTVTLLYMFSRTFTTFSHMYLPIYLQTSLKAPAYTIGTVPVIMNSSALVASVVLIPRLTRILGKKTLFKLGTASGLIASVILFSASNHLIGVYFYSGFVGIALSILLVTSLNFTSDLIGNNTGDSAFVYGYIVLVDKIIYGTLVWTIQTIARFQCTDCSEYYSWVVKIVPTILMLLAFFVVFFIEEKIPGKAIAGISKGEETSPLLYPEPVHTFSPEEELCLESNYGSI